MGQVHMQIGQLDKRIELQSAAKVSDCMGGSTLTYSTSATVAAAIWPVSAKEMVAANAPSMTITHKIRIRYLSTVKASWRVKYGSRYFDIISIVNPNEDDRWLDLICKELIS